MSFMCRSCRTRSSGSVGASGRASNSAGTSSADGRVGEGTTLGIHAALGLSLDLNVLDRAAARGFDNAMGVNHTYAFFEAFWADLNGLGQAHAPERRRLYLGSGHRVRVLKACR